VYDSADLQQSLRDAYWENKCEAYTSIISQIKPLQEQKELERKKWNQTIKPIIIGSPPHEESKEVGWY
jgi:hypothetical protein